MNFFKKLISIPKIQLDLHFSKELTAYNKVAFSIKYSENPLASQSSEGNEKKEFWPKDQSLLNSLAASNVQIHIPVEKCQ